LPVNGPHERDGSQEEDGEPAAEAEENDGKLPYGRSWSGWVLANRPARVMRT
jgi:hypothetical protein